MHAAEEYVTLYYTRDEALATTLSLLPGLRETLIQGLAQILHQSSYTSLQTELPYSRPLHLVCPGRIHTLCQGLHRGESSTIVLAPKVCLTLLSPEETGRPENRRRTECPPHLQWKTQSHISLTTLSSPFLHTPLVSDEGTVWSLQSLYEAHYPLNIHFLHTVIQYQNLGRSVGRVRYTLPPT